MMVRFGCCWLRHSKNDDGARDLEIKPSFRMMDGVFINSLHMT